MYNMYGALASATPAPDSPRMPLSYEAKRPKLSQRKQNAAWPSGRVFSLHEPQPSRLERQGHLRSTRSGAGALDNRASVVYALVYRAYVSSTHEVSPGTPCRPPSCEAEKSHSFSDITRPCLTIRSRNLAGRAFDTSASKHRGRQGAPGAGHGSQALDDNTTSTRRVFPL